MNKELEGHDNPALDQSGEPPNRRNVQGEALQMNDKRQETCFFTAAQCCRA
jgi:hypothetical protein